MSTRAQVRFATREDGVSFSEHPDKVNAQFYVHSDGYPEGLGVDIARSIVGGRKVDMEIENVDLKHGDLDYIYYVWAAEGKDVWISIFERSTDDEYSLCTFVGTPDKLIKKYDTN